MSKNEKKFATLRRIRRNIEQCKLLCRRHPEQREYLAEKVRSLVELALKTVEVDATVELNKNRF